MNYKIKPLTPETVLVFTEYIGNLEFSHAPHWATCYCRFYHTTCSREQWQNRTGADNREEAIEQINSGIMKGYLAFDGDKCIGWCNANDAKQYLRLEEDIKSYTNNQRVGCVICFVIHPEYRRQGVARLLLKKAVEDFKEQGYDAVLALPVEIEGAPEKLYRGTINMYKEHGFHVIDQQDGVSVMWLEL